MKTMEAFYRLERAEEFFDFFGVAYDQGVIEAFRVPLLRRFRAYKARIEARDPKPNEEEAIKFLRLSLLKAYGEVIREEVRKKGLANPCVECQAECGVSI
jgi:nitrogenase-stabilizing/protective protein